jgi:hypothetical protein
MFLGIVSGFVPHASACSGELQFDEIAQYYRLDTRLPAETGSGTLKACATWGGSFQELSGRCRHPRHRGP